MLLIADCPALPSWMLSAHRVVLTYHCDDDEACLARSASKTIRYHSPLAGNPTSRISPLLACEMHTRYACFAHAPVH
jgi:hypothetical protein